MSEEQLRVLIRACNTMEKRLKAPYAKARRSWATRRAKAEAELERRKAQ